MRWKLVSLLLLAATVAQAAPRRFALVVGSDRGDRSEVTLRYAADDAQRLAKVLTGIGGFHPEDVQVFTDVSASDVERALIELNARIRAQPEALLLVFFSGHGDADSLHLRGSRLPMATLRNLVTGSPAGARILIVDACRSGALTLLKGGHPAPAFQIDFDEQLSAEGTAILTSSAAGEDSQESESLGGSFFTHFLDSGLIGAADANSDGKVTLEESFAYASERTVAATSATVAGPQHPTFRFELGGQRDLVITQPGMADPRFGALRFREPGAYVVHQGERSGRVVAEVDSAKGQRRIVLAPGQYFVVRRFPDYLLEGRYVTREAQTTDVVSAAMRRVDFAQVVRKGGTQRQAAWSWFSEVGWRTSVMSLGQQTGFAWGLRWDLPLYSFELRLGSAVSDHQNPFGDLTSTETFGTVAALKAFDLGMFTAAVGLEVGGAWWHQSYPQVLDGFYPMDEPRGTHDGGGFLVGPTANLHFTPPAGKFFARLDFALETEFVRTALSSGPAWTTSVGFRWALGAGWFF
jgi:hypothetical protein